MPGQDDEVKVEDVPGYSSPLPDLTEEEKKEVDILAARIMQRDAEASFDESSVELPDGRKVTAKEFREMAKFCENFIQDVLPVFIGFQEMFKKAALAFTNFAELLEADATIMKKQEKAERRAKHPVSRTTIENDPPVTTANVFDGPPNVPNN